MEFPMQENASRCDVALGSLVAASHLPTSPATSLVSTRDLANIHERFSQWAGNLGALQPPESASSLDHRLKNSPQIYDAIAGMLQDLYDAARSAKDILEGVRENRIAEPTLSPDVDLAEFDISSSESDCSISAEPEPGQVTEIEQLTSIIKLSLDNLFKASIFIRKFSPKDKRRERARTTQAFDNQADVMYITDRYPSLAGSDSSGNPLAIRLGEANARRRQYFKYCRDHNERLSTPAATKQVAHAGAPLDQPPRPRDSGGAPISSRGSKRTRETHMVDTEATELAIPEVETLNLADHPPKSVVSFATTVIEPGNDELPYPPVPPEARTSSSILCPYCWTVVWLQDGNKDHQWRKHVLSDLAPYTCTFPECKLELFDSQHIWFEHELQVHRSNWVCPVCASAFGSPPDLHRHIKTQHGDKISDNQIAMVLKQSIRPVDSVDPGQCPFCDEQWASAVTIDASPNQTLAVSRDQFRKHLGHHLEQIALFSLPRFIQTQGSNVNRLSSTLERGRLQPNTHQWVSDHGRGWTIVLSRGATLMAMSYFMSLYENLELHVAVKSARVAVSRTHKGYQVLLRLNYLHLSVSLQKRYRQTQELRDLYEALQAGEASSSSSSTSDTMDNLHNISVLLYQQFERSGSMTNLDESIHLARITAASAWQPDNLPIYRLGLMKGLTRRFGVTKSTADLEATIKFVFIFRGVGSGDDGGHWATRPKEWDLLLVEMFGRTRWIDDLKNTLESLIQDTAPGHVPWRRIFLCIGSYLERVEIPELELHLDGSINGMVIDTFPQYRLWKRSLLGYLKQQFPSYSNDISVEEHGTVYRLTIPQKLTAAQRSYIFRHVCYRPENDDD